ncbi:MAG: hypothetical protein KGL39_32255 [Patescibacteria group bacterium]|nr:hypothetical protein [Patescibacteria group bacterium]
MADIADVCNTLSAMIAGVLYPNGTSAPPVPGYTNKVYFGWPIPAQLDRDLSNSITNINVYPRPEERNTTRYNLQWQQSVVNTPTLTATLSGQTVTIAGTAPTPTNPQNIMVMVNGLPYIYPAQTSDTPSTIASALAAMIVNAVLGTSSTGPVLQLPNSARLTQALVGVSATGMQEIRRQERLIQIGFWAPSPAARDALTQAVDLVLAGTQFITLPDLSAGRIIYKSSHLSDQIEKQKLYRRDLFYTVEYGTFQTETEYQILVEQINVSADIAGTPPPQPIATIYI